MGARLCENCGEALGAGRVTFCSERCHVTAVKLRRGRHVLSPRQRRLLVRIGAAGLPVGQVFPVERSTVAALIYWGLVEKAGPDDAGVSWHIITARGFDAFRDFERH